MKKTIITMLIALVAMVAGAETYNYLKFTKTNGSTVTYSVEGLKLTYDNTNVYVTNAETSATIALAEVQDMYFSNEAAPAYKRGDVNGDGEVDINDVTCLIDVVLGNNIEHNAQAADCNTDAGDGNIDINDVTALINRVLTGSW